jgi:cobalt-zinc-cadmium efflux system membrane fusion protein
LAYINLLAAYLTASGQFEFGGRPGSYPMKKTAMLELCLCLVWAAPLVGCGVKAQSNPAGGAPPPAIVEKETNGDDPFKVDHPDQVPLAVATAHSTAVELNVTGTVNAETTRSVPVVSTASGRIAEIHARLGDTVKRDQLLLEVQSQGITQAFSDYRRPVADEVLAKTHLNRSKILYQRGAIARKDPEVAQGVEDKAVVTVETALDHLKVLGADPKSPTAVVSIYAPASGIITDQQVTVAAGTQGPASPNAFTISDLSHVWIVCDVYKNDMSFVRLGEYADIHIAACPNPVLKGRISNIGAAMDPNIRTAKVRLEVANPGILRLGMLVTATFHSRQLVTRAAVPATAILHLHDRDWVYVPVSVPVGGGQFKRLQVTSGSLLPDNMQELTGIDPGQRVVRNALALQAAVEQAAQ